MLPPRVVLFNFEGGGAKSYLDGAVTSDVAGNGCRGPTVPAIPKKDFAPFGSLALFNFKGGGQEGGILF